MLGDARTHFRQRQAVVKAHANARGVGRQAQNMKAIGVSRRAELAAADGCEQGLHRLRIAVWVVAGRVAKDVGNGGFQFARLVGPENGGRVAHLDALGRVAAQQVVQGGGVGEGGGLTHGRVLTLALGFAIGLESARVEGHDVRPRGLRAPHAFDGGVQLLHRRFNSAHQAHGPARVRVASAIQHRLHHGGPLANKAHLTLQAKTQYGVGL